jgi:hypothetical protein
MVRFARRRRRLDRALADPGPATRLAALDLLDERGVSGHLNVLVERALVEDDPQVRAALVGVLRTAEWEPSSDRRLLQLKSWAARCVAEPVPEDSSLISQSSSTNSNRADIGPEADRGPDEGAPSTSEKQDQEQPVGTVSESDRWFSDLLNGDAFDSPETEIDSLSTFSIARNGNGNGGNGDSGGGLSRGVPSGSSRDPIAKAEQNAMSLLREAGYRVATTSERSQSDTVGIGAVDPFGSSLDANDIQHLTELCVRRVITATILEEATRRMRAENSRLEALLARFKESR